MEKSKEGPMTIELGSKEDRRKRKIERDTVYFIGNISNPVWHLCLLDTIEFNQHLLDQL